MVTEPARAAVRRARCFAKDSPNDPERHMPMDPSRKRLLVIGIALATGLMAEILRFFGVCAGQDV